MVSLFWGGGSEGTESVHILSLRYTQSTLRPPEVHMFYRKIELCIVRMGDNDMRTACTLEQEMVDHVILELHIKEASRYN